MTSKFDHADLEQYKRVLAEEYGVDWMDVEIERSPDVVCYDGSIERGTHDIYLIGGNEPIVSVERLMQLYGRGDVDTNWA